MNFDEIPLELKEIKSLEYYNKLMALEYSNLTPENINDEIKILKMSIDFDWSEKLHFIKLAQLFYKEKKYKEAIMLAKYLVTVSETPPPWLVLAKSYRDLGMYGESIEAYKIYTGMNENDKEAKQEYVDMLDKIVGFEE
jgi:predicted Zn-dependent protease